MSHDPILTVGDLRRALENLPADAVILTHNHSENDPAYQTMWIVELQIEVKGVPAIFMIDSDREVPEDDDGNLDLRLRSRG